MRLQCFSTTLYALEQRLASHTSFRANLHAAIMLRKVKEKLERAPGTLYCAPGREIFLGNPSDPPLLDLNVHSSPLRQKV